MKVYVTKRRGRLNLCWREGNRVRYKACRTEDETDAELQRRQLERELQTGARDPFERHRNRPLLDHLEEYLAAMTADGTRLKHVHMTRQRVRRVLDAGHIRFIRDLSASGVKTTIAAFACLAPAAKTPRDRPPLSAQSRNFYIQSMKQLCRWLVVEQRMPSNPLAALKKWNVATDRRHDRVRIFPDEFAKLVAAAERSPRTIEGMTGSERALLYRIAYTTGLRRGEIGSLTPRCLDLASERPTMTVAATNTKNRQMARFRLHDDLVEPLRERIRGLRPDEPLFPGLWQRKTGAKLMQHDLKRAGIPYRTEDGRYRDFHALRSFISQLWDAGATPPVAQRLARHSDIRLTMRYSHVNTEAEDEIIARLPRLPIPNATPRADQR
jgi:integrase